MNIFLTKNVKQNKAEEVFNMGLLKIRFKTVDTTSVMGIYRAIRLTNNGWKIAWKNHYAIKFYKVN